jgi:hypothetical protein
MSAINRYDDDLFDELVATGEIGERPTAYTGMKSFGLTLRARRLLRQRASSSSSGTTRPYIPQN